jgi:hypothetical protein
MTADWMIKKQFQENAITAVVVDHGHNDRGKEWGESDHDEYTITAISTGATTQITLSDASSLVENRDGVVVLFDDDDDPDIPFLHHAAAMITDVTGNVVTLNIDSSAYSGSFIAGKLLKYDRATVFGGWGFIIHYIRNCSIVYGDGNVKIVLSPPPSEFTTDRNDNHVYNIGRAIRLLSLAYDVNYFDILYEMGVTGPDQLTFFPDTIHPTVLGSRKAIAYYWIRWFQGGAAKVFGNLDFLPTGDPDFVDGSLAYYSRFTGGWGSAKVVTGDATAVLSDDFSDGNTVGWTLIGNAPVIAAAPWDALEFALLFTADGGTATSTLHRSVTLGRGRVVEFDFSLPAVVGLTTPSSPTPSSVVLFQLRSGGAYYNLKATIGAASVSLALQYFETANTTLHSLSPAPSMLLAADTKYHVKVEMYQGSDADNPGHLLFYINDALVGGPYSLDDFGQGAIQRFDFGPGALNTGTTFTIHMGNIVLSQFPVTAYGDPLLESFVLRVSSDETTDLTTGTSKYVFRMPYAFELTDVRASVATAATGATLLTVDVNESGTTILSTKLTFDASEKTTTTAATQRVISDTTLADDAEITVDIDAIGNTLPGKGLKVYLIGHKTT